MTIDGQILLLSPQRCSYSIYQLGLTAHANQTSHDPCLPLPASNSKQKILVHGCDKLHAIAN